MENICLIDMPKEYGRGRKVICPLKMVLDSYKVGLWRKCSFSSKKWDA